MTPCTYHGRDCTGEKELEGNISTHNDFCLPCAIAFYEDWLSNLYTIRNRRDLTTTRRPCKACNKRFPASHLNAYDHCPACGDALDAYRRTHFASVDDLLRTP